MASKSGLLFDTPEWFDDRAADQMLKRFRQLRSFGMHTTANSLNGLDKLGLIPEGASRIFEFGSGLGEGLISLDMFAKYRGGAVIRGSEIKAPKRRVARAVASLLGSVVGVGANGLDELANADEPFDLILANMLGPSYNDDVLPSTFIPAALDTLSADGVVVINSDCLTMDSVNHWVAQNLPAEKVTMLEPELGIPFNTKITLPQTVISR